MPKQKTEIVYGSKVATMATEREAREVTSELINKFRLLGTAWFQLGKEVKDCLARQVPRAYGLATAGKPINAIEWMEVCFPNSRAKIYRALKIATVLEKVPEDKVNLLTEGNAYYLTTLPAKLATSDEWLAKAAAMPNDEFKAAVDGALAKNGHPVKEKWLELFPRFPATVKELFQETEKKLGEAMEIDTELYPEKRATVWERVIVMLYQTGENTLREALVGREGEEVPE